MYFSYNLFITFNLININNITYITIISIISLKHTPSHILVTRYLLPEKSTRFFEQFCKYTESCDKLLGSNYYTNELVKKRIRYLDSAANIINLLTS